MPPTRLINAAVGHHLSSPTVGPVHHRQPPPNSLHPRAPQISPLATPGYFAGVHLGLSPAPSNSSTPLRSPPRPPLATLQEFTWTSVQHLQTPRHPSHLPPGHPRLLCRSSPGPLSSTSKLLYTPQIFPQAIPGYFAGVHLGLGLPLATPAGLHLDLCPPGVKQISSPNIHSKYFHLRF